MIPTTFRFAWRTRKKHILCAMGAIALAALLLNPLQHNWSWLEPLIGFTTLVVAFMVWIGEVAQDEENALPKRLTVIFLYKGREVLICEKAYLAGEGDIRSWGQQLGGQMADNPQLRFEPLILQDLGQVIVDQESGQKVKLYTVRFTLTKLPERFDGQGRLLNAEVVAHLKAGYKRLWSYDPQQQGFTKQWLPGDQ